MVTIAVPPVKYCRRFKPHICLGTHLRPEDKLEIEVAAAPVESAGRLRVLAVDDSPFSRKLVEHALRGQPDEVAFAKDGREALASISEFRPNVVITGWMLPDLSGPELCRRIRTEAKNGYTYVILLTSNVEKESIVEGWRLERMII